VRPKRSATSLLWNVVITCKIVLLKLAHSLRSRTLSVVILTGLSGGLVAKISAPSSVPEEPSHSLRKMVVSMQRL
jgi:hypothetical protein